MSYILRALQKAERERKRDQALDIHSLDQDHWSEREDVEKGATPLIWLIPVVSVIVIMLFAWFWLQRDLQPAQDTVNSAVVATPSDAGFDQGGSSLNFNAAPPSDASFARPNSSDSRRELAERLGNQPGLDNSAIREESSPLSTQSPLPAFSGHLYFPDNAASSRVFYRGDSFREGEQVAGYEIVRIDESRVQLRLGEQEFSVKLD